MNRVLGWALPGFVAGVAVQLQQTALWAWPVCAALLLAAPLVWRLRLPLAWALAGALVGFALTGVRAAVFLSGALDPALEGRTLAVVGRVASLPQVTPQGERFEFAVEAGPLGLAAGSTLRLGWFARPGEALPVIEPGSRELRSLFAVHRSSAVLKALCQHPKLVDIARQLLGSDVYIHQSRVNYKGGFRGKEFYWHSDFETWHVEDGMPRMRALSCSILLTDNRSSTFFKAAEDDLKTVSLH